MIAILMGLKVSRKFLEIARRVDIVEFEQNGKDLARHGECLLYSLSEALKQQGLTGVSYTNLTLFRKFYLTYPQFMMIARDVVALDWISLNLQPLAEDLRELNHSFC